MHGEGTVYKYGALTDCATGAPHFNQNFIEKIRVKSTLPVNNNFDTSQTDKDTDTWSTGSSFFFSSQWPVCPFKLLLFLFPFSFLYFELKFNCLKLMDEIDPLLKEKRLSCLKKGYVSRCIATPKTSNIWNIKKKEVYAVVLGHPFFNYNAEHKGLLAWNRRLTSFIGMTYVALHHINQRHTNDEQIRKGSTQQIDRQTGKQTNRQADRQTHISSFLMNNAVRPSRETCVD